MAFDDTSAGRSPNPVDLHVGARVRLRRKLLGMSQELLADTLGLTFQQVQKYERGANRVSASKLYEIAKTLQAPVSYFFEGLADPVDPSSAPAQENPCLALAGPPAWRGSRPGPAGRQQHDARQAARPGEPDGRRPAGARLMALASTEAQACRVADVLCALENAPLSARSAPLCVISRDAEPRTVLGVFADGQRFVLSSDDVELTARILVSSQPFAGCTAIANSLLGRLGMAELLTMRANVVRMCSGWGRG